MDKDQDLGETVELGIATIETLGGKDGGSELSNMHTHSVGISDYD